MEQRALPALNQIKPSKHLCLSASSIPWASSKFSSDATTVHELRQWKKFLDSTMTAHANDLSYSAWGRRAWVVSGRIQDLLDSLSLPINPTTHLKMLLNEPQSCKNLLQKAVKDLREQLDDLRKGLEALTPSFAAHDEAVDSGIKNLADALLLCSTSSSAGVLQQEVDAGDWSFDWVAEKLLHQWIIPDVLGKQQRTLVFIVGPALDASFVAAKIYDHPKNSIKKRSWVIAAECFRSNINSATAAYDGFHMNEGMTFSERVSHVKIADQVMGHEDGSDAVEINLVRAYLKGNHPLKGDLQFFGSYFLVLDDVKDIKSWDELSDALPSRDEGVIIITTACASIPILIGMKMGFKEVKIHICLLAGHQSRLSPAIFRTEVSPQVWSALFQCINKDNIGGREGGGGGNQQLNTPAVRAAYARLSPDLKRCLLCFCSFPSHVVVSKKRLARIWVAYGFAGDEENKEDAAAMIFDKLVERKLISQVIAGPNGDVVGGRIPDFVRKYFTGITSFREDLDVKETLDLKRFHTYELHEEHPKSLAAILDDANPVDASLILSEKPQVSSWTTLHSRYNKEKAHDTVQGADAQQRSLASRLTLPAQRREPAKFKLLRVLELTGVASVDSLPEDSLGYLSLLRYLGLRKTRVKELPESIQGLRLLETLDARETLITELPGLSKLRRMRHLLLVKSRRDLAVEVPLGLHGLRNLRTLSGVKCNKKIAGELSNLTQLRKLSIGQVQAQCSAALVKSLNRMQELQSLSISCRLAEWFDLKDMRIPKKLTKVGIGGRIFHGGMNPVLKWLAGSFGGLSCLYLWDCVLEEDPLGELQGMENLALLSLCNAFVGEEMGCGDGGFKRLKKLSVVRFAEVKRWRTIGDGALPRLKELFVGHCPKLEMLPMGMEKLGRLERVDLIECPLVEQYEENRRSEGTVIDRKFQLRKISMLQKIWV